MKAGYHFSVDDVFDSMVMVSDWRIRVTEQPFLSFCSDLASEGARTDLYLFRRKRCLDGRVRHVEELLNPFAIEALSAVKGIRFGPHAEDYETPPYAQTVEAQAATMSALFEAIAGFAPADSRSRWVRLHYFSECYELAPLFHAWGVEALLTTDKPALTYRMGPTEAEALRLSGRTEINRLGMVRSHLRLENHLEDASDLPRFLARIDEALDRHGFVTLFSHEIDFDDARVRSLARAAVKHLARLGVPAI